MRRTLIAAAVVAILGPASAQAQFVNKPIDTQALIVQPTSQATGFLSGVTNTVSQVAAKVIDGNGYVKTLNNLFGTKTPAPPSQINGLPAPSLYPSTRYQNSFQPAMPTSSTLAR